MAPAASGGGLTMDVRERLVALFYENNVRCDQKIEGLADDVIDIIAHSVTTHEWISVKDRLPENGAHVLLCCEMHRYGGEIAGKYVCDGYYAEANKIIAGGFPDECDCEYSEEDDEYYLREGWYEVIKNWDDYNSVTVGDFVTHWMPLPKAPETKKTKEE